MKNTLILGVGNTIRGDDGIGVFAVRALREDVGPFVDIKEIEEGALGLLDITANYDRVIIIDSIITRKGSPGSIYRIGKESLERLKLPYSSHQMGLNTVVEMGRNLGIALLPEEIIVYAIEIERKDSFSERLSLKVKEAVPRVIDLIKKELKK